MIARALPLIVAVALCGSTGCGGDPPPRGGAPASRITRIPDAVPRPRGGRSRPRVVTEAEMIEGGLRFLARRQNPDGSFGGRDARSARVGISAIATLSLLAHGDTENRGPYAKEVKRAVRFLLNCSTKEGPRIGYLTANGDNVSRMHGHGYATLALTQAYGMLGVRRSRDGQESEIRRVIRGAVDCILRSQNSLGGWSYEPTTGDNANVDDEGSMTVCMIQALRGAHNCGFVVPKKAIDKACDYVRQCQNTDGSFRYQLAGSDQATMELTAASCSVLINAGRYYDVAVRNGRDHLWRESFDQFLATPSPTRGYPYYGLFYVAQVLQFDYDRDMMRRRYPEIVQWYRRFYDQDSGTFVHSSLPQHQEMQYGDCYRVAFATLTLQVTDGYLPIFQR